jgi:hypothetical protein
MEPGDWLVFLDHDVQRAVCDVDRFPRLMPIEDGVGNPCHFIAQDSGPAVHTGFVAVEQSARGLDLVQAWLDEQVFV